MIWKWSILIHFTFQSTKLKMFRSRGTYLPTYVSFYIPKFQIHSRMHVSRPIIFEIWIWNMSRLVYTVSSWRICLCRLFKRLDAFLSGKCARTRSALHTPVLEWYGSHYLRTNRQVGVPHTHTYESLTIQCRDYNSEHLLASCHVLSCWVLLGFLYPSFSCRVHWCIHNIGMNGLGKDML